MIRKVDILERAEEWQLRPDVVEKDYVLGWLLAALARHPTVPSTWVFKGGTCLKKCYFETYRLSEDLDFSLRPEASYDANGLRALLVEIVRDATELSGITFPLDLVTVETKRDKLGRPTFRARITYGGPLAHPGGPRVLFDITQHEPLLDEPVARPIHHPYPDDLPVGTLVQCYSLDELLAEKTRALVERTRPRDLYDVVYVFENLAAALNLSRFRQVFHGKCDAKSIAVPTASSIVALVHGSAELRADWSNMLGHQLPLLPEIEGFLARLTTLLACLEEAGPIPAALTGAPLADGESLVVDSGVRFWGRGVPLELVRFAGANRLLVEFDYHGRHRLAEPYSLRTASTGNLLLYAWERGSMTIKAFKVGEIQNLRATQTAFALRYRIEFTEGGPLRAPTIRTE